MFLERKFSQRHGETIVLMSIIIPLLRSACCRVACCENILVIYVGYLHFASDRPMNYRSIDCAAISLKSEHFVILSSGSAPLKAILIDSVCFQTRSKIYVCRKTIIPIITIITIITLRYTIPLFSVLVFEHVCDRS